MYKKLPLFSNAAGKRNLLKKDLFIIFDLHEDSVLSILYFFFFTLVYF